MLMSYNNRDKRYYSTNHNPVNKLVINSKYNNLIFDDNMSVLFMSLDKDILEIVKNLNKGCYTFNFYSYIQDTFKMIFLF